MKLYPLLKASVLTAIASLVVFVPTVKPMGEHPASIGASTPPAPIKAITEPPQQPFRAVSYKEEPKPVEPAPAPAPVVTAPTSPNEDKAFIYQHESGNRTTAVNSIGCRGLGQACPGSKLPCGDDYACQDAFFTKYAMDRYGSWANARKFWEANRWW